MLKVIESIYDLVPEVNELDDGRDKTSDCYWLHYSAFKNLQYYKADVPTEADAGGPARVYDFVGKNSVGLRQLVTSSRRYRLFRRPRDEFNERC